MPYLKIRKVRTILNVSRPTVMRLITSGELKAIKIGSAPNSPIGVDEDSLNAYIERQRVEADA